MQLHSKFGLLADFCVSLKRLKRIFFFKSLQIIFIMYIMYIPSTNFEKKEKKWWSYCFVSKPCFRDFQFAPWLAGYPSVKLLQCYTQVYLPKISFLIERFFILFVFPKISRVSQNFKLFSWLTECSPEIVCRQFCNTSMHLQRQVHSLFCIVDSSAG